MIELLVDRLRWPAPLVRERAASQLGNRIAAGDDGAVQALLVWIADQELESLAAIGLLPFLRAVGQEGARLPATNKIASAVQARSVLSDLYLDHLDPPYASNPNLGRHSGPPPGSWTSQRTETGLRAASPEGIQREQLRRIGRYSRVPLERQFDFELSVLSSHAASSAHAERAAGDYDRGYHPGWHPVSKEIRASAYLRSLAWAASCNSVPNDRILAAAALCSPVDLGLWGVRSTSAPAWWPSLDPDGDEGEVDKEVATALRAIDEVVQAWQSDDNVVLAASGCLSQTKVGQHDLEVRAFFQRTYGPHRPESEELFEHLKSARSWVNQEESPLRFEGPVVANGGAQELADWVVAPCSGSTQPLAITLWQGWRGLRGFQCPSPELVDGEIRAICRQDSVDYECAGELVAQWTDWSRSLSAIAVRDLLPASGWVLVAPRAVVDRFTSETGMALAWAWEITSHFRDYAHGEFMVHRTHGDHGTTMVIRP